MPLVLRIEDGAAEIAGQRRTKDGAGIVARQAGKTIGGLAIDPASTSVSMRSPTMMVSAASTPSRSSALRIMNEFGFPTK